MVNYLGLYLLQYIYIQCFKILLNIDFLLYKKPHAHAHTILKSIFRVNLG